MWTPTCRAAFEEAISLKPAPARALISKELSNHPENHIPLLLENYLDLFQVFLYEQESELRQFEINVDRRLAHLDQADADSPWKRYCQAEVQLQLAIGRMKFEEYFSAFWEIRRAFKLLQENQARFPDFYPNLKSMGYIHALIGTLPDNYKWGLKILGLKGEVKQGMTELASFIEQAQEDELYFYEEAIGLYAFFLVYLDKDFEQARGLLYTELNKPDNLFLTFLRADLAFRLGETDLAIEILEKRPLQAPYLDFPFLHYLEGMLKVYRQDADADVSILHFLSSFEGRHYIKEANQKLWWFYFLKGEEEKAEQFRLNVIADGNQILDADKSALKDAQENKALHADLLKARLLYDGAYHQDALEVLTSVSVEELNKPHEQIEYYYRLARISEGLQQWEQAIENYKHTMLKGEGLGLYYPAKSALQCGLIYEGRAEFDLANEYFKKCLAYKGHPFKNSFDQQANAGLSRLRSK